jgi:hypothetical protein
MITSYMFQVAQMNEKSPSKSSLDLRLIQHLRNEDPKPWEMHLCLKIETPLNLVLLKFSKLLYLGNFVANQLHF